MTASMKSSCFVIVLLLAIATASSLSLAAARETSSIPAIVGRELRGLVARAGGMLSSAGWRTAKSTDDVAEVKNLRAAAARRRPRKTASVSCVTAAMCRKKRVICGKRCYGASRASLNHVPSRCVVKCKKCVPTC
ncbi:uncharacterized protein LOC133923585 [Phragmites australis]|uniref:uncharacterized protein LOC133923585 n=1 Tax=Phragmites australis TaxID=29695 RepID=UPI002D78C755|nr:uncharacterized protein LOC133923585 [Phragmites australis]